jgi:hypothetical protein
MRTVYPATGRPIGVPGRGAGSMRHAVASMVSRWGGRTCSRPHRRAAGSRRGRRPGVEDLSAETIRRRRGRGFFRRAGKQAFQHRGDEIEVGDPLRRRLGPEADRVENQGAVGNPQAVAAAQGHQHLLLPGVEADREGDADAFVAVAQAEQGGGGGHLGGQSAVGQATGLGVRWSRRW